jgi:hypothetical protein
MTTTGFEMRATTAANDVEYGIENNNNVTIKTATDELPHQR